MDFLDQLNPIQKQAAMQIEGSVMIVAGAGSGKTRVLTYRIANMIRQQIPPFNIMALTFTNKAAQEMKSRISDLIGGHESKSLWMGTFHSVFSKILRAECDRLGYPSNFTIYDTQDSKNLLKKIIKDIGLDDKKYKLNIIYSRISNAKNNLISASSYAVNQAVLDRDKQSGLPEVYDIYKRYELECFRNGAMDFDDLIFKTNVLFRDFPDVLYKYQHRFKYLLVDEFQDTNLAQYNIVRKLAAVHENICVVGDDAQSIYGFRGADIQNILSFKNDYQDVKAYKLEQNYRSTKHIVSAANSVIKKNTDQLEKTVWTDNSKGDKIEVFQCPSDSAEAALISKLIGSKVEQIGPDYSQFAILYRTNMQSRALEESMRRFNMPYKIYGGTSFYQRKEIKDVLAYLKVSINRKDNESLKRIINYPVRGIGKTTIDKVLYFAESEDIPFYTAIEQIATLKANLGLNSGAVRKIVEFYEMMEHFSTQIEKKDAHEFIHDITNSTNILKVLFEDKTPEGISRYDNVKELMNGVKEFVDNEAPNRRVFIADYLENVSLLTDNEEDKETDKNRVSLMTIHASKGLEFPYVYLVGLEEELFPSARSIYTKEDLEEERRLFYVALTRAEKKVIITHAQSRYRMGSLNYCEPSRFIEDIDPEHIDMVQSPSLQGRMPSKNVGIKDKSYSFKKRVSPVTAKEKSSAPIIKPSRAFRRAPLKTSQPVSNENRTLSVGNKVRHSKFGKGVVKIIDEGKAVVDFEKFGEKKLLLEFAILEII